MPNFIENAWSKRAAEWGGRMATRFPPEPNGHLHIGHAKSVALNFGLARANAGTCALRFDDTNPAKEELAFELGIEEMVRWLGFAWDGPVRRASDHFAAMDGAALFLIERGLAHVDLSAPEAMRSMRGSLTGPGTPSPDRGRPPAWHRERFAEMLAGRVPEGGAVLRAKIDMASPNMNLRDPVLYRIKLGEHPRLGRSRSAYPSYDFAHPFCDAMEGISLSLCTLEFEDHRPLYEWVAEHCAASFPAPGSAPEAPLRAPEQIEFARLELDRGVTSKRAIAAWIASGAVEGWDDPRLLTLLGLRRRGFTPSSILAFVEAAGVSRSNAVTPFSRLEEALRAELDPITPRRVFVEDPIELDVVEGGPESPYAGSFPNNPHDPGAGERPFPVGSRWWVERADARLGAEPGFKRLAPGMAVRLMRAYVVRVLSVEAGPDGRPLRVLAARDDGAKPRGTIHALERSRAVPARVCSPDVLPSADCDPALFLRESLGYAESSALADGPDERVHAVRLGYGRWDPADLSLPRRWIKTVGLKEDPGKAR